MAKQMMMGLMLAEGANLSTTSSTTSFIGVEGEGLALGEMLGLSELEGDKLGESELLGLTLGLTELDWLIEADSLELGLIEGELELEGLTLALGLNEGELLLEGEMLGLTELEGLITNSLKEIPINPQSSDLAGTKSTVLAPAVPEFNQYSLPQT